MELMVVGYFLAYFYFTLAQVWDIPAKARLLGAEPAQSINAAALMQASVERRVGSAGLKQRCTPLR
jgi:hypothetical protein